MKTLHTRFVAVLFLSFTFIVTSCGDGSSKYNMKVPGVDGPRLTLNQDDILITMVFEKLDLDSGLRYNIPKYPNSYIEISPDLQSDGTLMAVSISLDDVFNGRLRELDPQSLPGGRAIPGTRTGALPAVAFTIEKFHNMKFYIGKDIFGMFVPIKGLRLDGAIISSRFYSGKLRTGNLSIVSEDDQGENGGILLMLDMKRSTKKKLKKIAKKY